MSWKVDLVFMLVVTIAINGFVVGNLAVFFNHLPSRLQTYFKCVLPSFCQPFYYGKVDYSYLSRLRLVIFMSHHRPFQDMLWVDCYPDCISCYRCAQLVL